MSTYLSIGYFSDFPLSREALSRAIETCDLPQQMRIVQTGTIGSIKPNRRHLLDAILLDIEGRTSDALSWIERHQRVSQPTPVILIGRYIDDYVIEQALMTGCKGVITEEQDLQTLARSILAVSHGEIWVQGKTSHCLNSRIKTTHIPSNGGASEDTLTKREMQIVTLFRDHPGYTATTLAAKLNLSESTLRNHLTRVYRKLGVRNRAALLGKLMRGQLKLRHRQQATYF